MGSDTNTKKFIGKYQIIEEIGKGGMGVVYKGIDPFIERTLAIKTIRLDIPKDEADHKKWKKRFLREAKLAGNLAHTNIVTIYDAGEEDGLFYIAMEYVEGKSLREMIRSSKKISFEEVRSLMKQICEALSYASKKGVIHCDIKPENIIIDKEGKVYLVDFGIARTSSADLTKTMLSMVTPSYTSPERLNGIEPDIRSDIFALGAVLYEIVSGKKAFHGDTVSTIMKSVLYDAPTKAEVLSSDIPKEIHYIISRALEKDPEERYQTYEDFYNDLLDYENLKPDESFEADYRPDEMTVLLPRKNRFSINKVAIAFAVAGIVIAGVLGIYVFRKPPEENAAPTRLGEKLLAERNYNKAIENLEKVLASNPSDLNANYLLGIAYQNKGLWDDSIARYEKAIAIDASFAPAYKGLAEAYEEKGEIAQAVNYNEKYIQLAEGSEDITSAKKKISELRNRIDAEPETEAATAMVVPTEKLPEKSPEPATEKAAKTDREADEENAYETGKTFFENGEYAQAISYFKEALSDNPENEDITRYLKLAENEEKKQEDIALNFELGIKSYENKNYQQAATYFNEILNLEPQNKEAKKYMSLIRQGALENKISDATRPAAIKERPFYQRVVKVLALGPEQARGFEKIYAKNGETLLNALRKTGDEEGRAQALGSFYRMVYGELRKILKPDQFTKLDNLIVVNQYRKNLIKSGSGKNLADEPPLAGTGEETTAEKEESAGTAGVEKEEPVAAENSVTTETGPAEEAVSSKELIAESLSLGVTAFNDKNYTQASYYFNEVLKSDPDNAEAKKYLEYIKLTKIKMLNEQTPSEADEEDTGDDANLPEGL